MSAHTLEIEVGRFGRDVTPRCDRHCKYCLSIGAKQLVINPFRNGVPTVSRRKETSRK